MTTKNTRRNYTQNCFPKGFTLIELLVVVLIIGILAAVALPQYNKTVRKAQGTEALIALDALDKAMHSYYLEHDLNPNLQVLTPDIRSINIDLPELKHWNYTRSASSEASYPGVSKLTDYILIQNHCSGTNCEYWTSVVSKENIEARVTHRAQETIFTCYVRDSQASVSCSDYFNCNATPRVQLQGISNYYWAGGDCTLK